MGLALTRLIFNGDKRNEDGTIKRLLNKALKMRQEVNMYGQQAETHNALGSLRQKQKNYAEAQVTHAAAPTDGLVTGTFTILVPSRSGA